MEAASRNGTPLVELTPGQNFTGRYACARKDRLTAKNGSAYLALELRDRSGSLPARIFRDSDRIGVSFDRGDVIAVKGRVEQFRGQLSAELEDVKKIDPAEIDPVDFLPTAYRDREELEGFLEHLAREVHHPGYRAVVEDLLFTGETAEAFRTAPCTRGGHHKSRRYANAERQQENSPIAYPR